MARKPIEQRLFVKDTKNNILWIKGYAHGKNWNASTGFTTDQYELDPELVIARASELERERLMDAKGLAATQARELAEKAERLTLKEAVGYLFDEDILNNSKPRTVEFHAQRCKSLLRNPADGGLGANSRIVEIITPSRLSDYFTRRLEGATLKQRHTIQKDYRVLRQILGILSRRGLWSGNIEDLKITAFHKSEKYYHPGETWLSEVEYINAFVEEISSGRSLVRRTKRNGQGREWEQRAIVHVDRKYHAITYMNMGLRDAELDSIFPHHVRLDLKTVAINYPKDAVLNEEELRKGKTSGAKRVLGLNPVQVEIFKHKLESADPDKPVFEKWQNADRDIKAAWRRARQKLIKRRIDAGDTKGAKTLEQTLPHSLCLNDLRRTFCSQMAKAGVPLQTCADILGHEDDTMVKRVYRRCAPAQLQSAMEMMPTIALPKATLQRAPKPNVVRDWMRSEKRKKAKGPSESRYRKRVRSEAIHPNV